jgi:hypothetical protein
MVRRTISSDERRELGRAAEQSGPSHFMAIRLPGLADFWWILDIAGAALY